MEETTEKKESVQKPSNPVLEKLHEEYEGNAEVLQEYLDKFSAIVTEANADERVVLLDIYRVLAMTLVRLTTSTYHKTEAEYQAEIGRAHRRVNEYFKNTLGIGTPDADPEEFRISRLILFSATMIETTMWNFFIGQKQPSTSPEES